MKPLAASLIFWASALLLACSDPSTGTSGEQLICDTNVLASIRHMPSLFLDSADMRAFERAAGSVDRISGIRRFVLHTPKQEFPAQDLGEQLITRLAFPVRVAVVQGDRYQDAHSVNDRYADYYMASALIPDHIDVARPRHGPVQLPVFYRPQPLPGVNMVVIHQMVDSMYGSTFGWRLLEEQSVIKLYHRDAVLDSVFPDQRAVGEFNPGAFQMLFDCLQTHFDSLYASRFPKHPVLTFEGLDGGTGAFKDKPFKHLVRHHSWLTADSVAVQLYCFPADVLDIYRSWGGSSDLLFDSVACAYKRVSQGTLGGVDHAYDIHWKDLAIWIVYTHIGQKKRAPHPE